MIKYTPLIGEVLEELASLRFLNLGVYSLEVEDASCFMS
jgi:hypothetical protein